MLRITVTEGDSEQKWILQGKLTKFSAPELISHWNARQNPSVARIVDLSEITTIDREGETVLSMMMCDGAEFVTSGVYTAYLLQELRKRPKGSHGRQ
jgi:ABC-type transporter Mla MlaB component